MADQLTGVNGWQVCLKMLSNRNSLTSPSKSVRCHSCLGKWLGFMWQKLSVRSLSHPAAAMRLGRFSREVGPALEVASKETPAGLVFASQRRLPGAGRMAACERCSGSQE